MKRDECDFYHEKDLDCFLTSEPTDCDGVIADCEYPNQLNIALRDQMIDLKAEQDMEERK